MEKDTLYYDDTCPICSAEMAKLARHHDEHLQLVPLTALPEAERHPLYSELHIKTKDGDWVKGLDANVLAWQHTRYRRLANLLMHPAIKWLALVGYNVWLLWYQWHRKRRLKNAH